MRGILIFCMFPCPIGGRNWWHSDSPAGRLVFHPNPPSGRSREPSDFPTRKPSGEQIFHTPIQQKQVLLSFSHEVVSVESSRTPGSIPTWQQWDWMKLCEWGWSGLCSPQPGVSEEHQWGRRRLCKMVQSGPLFPSPPHDSGAQQGAELTAYSVSHCSTLARKHQWGWEGSWASTQPVYVRWYESVFHCCQGDISRA